MKPEHYLPLLKTLERVPSNAPDFTISQEQGHEFGFSARDLTTFARAGLPHLRTNGNYMFRWGDLHYLGLRLDTAKPYLLSIRLWAKAFAQLSQSPQTEIEVDYTPKLNMSAPGGVFGKVVLPGGMQRTMALQSGDVSATVQACQYGQWPNPDPRLATILDGIGKLQLYMMPESLRDTAEQIAELGLADCESATQLAVAVCTHEGYEARRASGLLISFPFSIPHSWAEVRIDDEWMSFNPLTAATMREFARDDAPIISGSTCLGAVLLRIADAPVPLVSVDGIAVDVSFATRRLRATRNSS